MNFSCCTTLLYLPFQTYIIKLCLYDTSNRKTRTLPDDLNNVAERNPEFFSTYACEDKLFDCCHESTGLIPPILHLVLNHIQRSLIQNDQNLIISTDHSFSQKDTT